MPAAARTALALLASLLVGARSCDGEVLALDDPRLARWLPLEVHAARHALFEPGAALATGPGARSLAPPEPYRAATKRSAPGVQLGPGGRLEGYLAGQPFPIGALECASDPDAGTKLAWNAALAWEGDGADWRFRVRWEDDGETLPGDLEGWSRTVWLSHRIESVPLAQLKWLRDDERSFATVIEIDAPPAERGVRLVHYRSAPPDAFDQVWIYVPERRRIRRIRDRSPARAVPDGTLVREDFSDFRPAVAAFRWRCLGERRLLAPLARAPAPDAPATTSPGSLDDLRFELRSTLTLEGVPMASDAPYARRVLHLDRETLRPFYTTTFAADGRALCVALHAWAWSGDEPAGDETWEGMPAARVLLPHRTLVAHVETGARKRIDALERTSVPLPSSGRIRRLIAVGRMPE